MVKERTIIIYNNTNEQIKKINNFKNKNYLKTCLNVYTLYKGDIYNPPFFKHIIYLRNDINIDLFQLLWNMLLINGTIQIYIKNKNNFIKLLPNIKSEIKDDMIIIHKKINTIYTFKNYRTLDFIIAGVMKSGSTAALHNISMHPDIFMPNDEIHYFENLDNFGKGKEWLYSFLDFNYKLCGIKTSDASFFPISHQLMQYLNPYMKIIIFLRDPCERAYSHYKMMIEKPFNLKEKFEICIDDEINNRMDEELTYNNGLWNSYIRRGFYFEQIEPHYKVLFVLDDRSQNIKMFRELGLVALQCKAGDY